MTAQMRESERRLAQMRVVSFAAPCLVSIAAGIAAALGVTFAWASLLRLPTAYPMDYLFILLLLVGSVAPPTALLRLRRDQMNDYNEGLAHEPRLASARARPRPSTVSSNPRPDDPKGYYARLGIAATATGDEIKAAYRTQVKAFHPDTNPAADANIQWFHQLNEAYQ